jgi:hypothetical protein
MKRIIFVVVFLFLLSSSFTVFSQTVNTYNIKNPGKERATLCASCLEVRKQMPVEVAVSVYIDEQYDIYFYVTDPAWFSKLFKLMSDGVAIDIVAKEQFACNKENALTKSWACYGTLLPPVYLGKMKQTGKVINGRYVVKVGEVPPKFRGKEVEANWILIQNYNLCQYNRKYSVETFGWGLLDMGIYLDKLVFSSNKDSARSIYEKVYKKEFQFTVPFEKGKADYSAADMKSLYDSLNTPGYEIKSIAIRAYSSIEGTTQANIDLQEKRAQSIISGLQAYQKSTIKMDIHASENWVEFLQDIKSTKYADFTLLSKDEIKAKLTDKTIVADLEPILKKHRKAILFIEVDRKNNYNLLSPDQMITQFNTSVSDKDIKKALDLQTAIFDRLQHAAHAEKYIGKMEIPKKTEFSILLNNQHAYTYMMDVDAYSALLDLQELVKLFPDEGRIRYNICVMKFRVWLQGNLTIEPEHFKAEIEALTKYGISQSLIDRMLVNYYIIRGDIYMNQKDYVQKDSCLTRIKFMYNDLAMTDEDMLSLAQYFCNYSRYDWAETLIENKVNDLDANENLLFYYLSLTIGYTAHTDKPEYRAIMLNAVNINKQRFCKIFSSPLLGGSTFQLLRDDYLKSTYCENCTK